MFTGNSQNNLISWLVDVAEGEQRDIRDLVIRLLSVNFGAIHTTTMVSGLTILPGSLLISFQAFTHILYDLATYPEYVEPLREEVESVIATEGWSKVSTVNMHKVDSFIKESQRIAASGRECTVFLRL